MKFWANGFSSSTVPEWEDRSIISLMGPTSRDGFATNIVVTRQPVTESSITAFAKEQLDQLAREVPQIEVLDERTITVGGESAFQRLHVLQIKGQKVQQAQTYLMQSNDTGTTGFVITCSASPDEFPRHMPVFRRFTEEFRFFDPLAGGPT